MLLLLFNGNVQVNMHSGKSHEQSTSMKACRKLLDIMFSTQNLVCPVKQHVNLLLMFE